MFAPIDPRAFNEGWDAYAWRWLGAHVGESGTRFAVWAPDAEQVAVIGDFNGWDPIAAPLAPVGDSGIWQGVVPDAAAGARYKYRLKSRATGAAEDKADPFGAAHEEAPRTASIVSTSHYAWGDLDWMRARAQRQPHREPMQIYEVHLGSWRALDGGVSFRTIAAPLAQYAVQNGFTHVELMPVMEHPFYGSWGYQVTGFFAPTARYGSPDDLCYLIDTLHQAGLGVLLDWVPAHFPADAHALGRFDGTHLYEHADPRRGWHPDWNTYIFNYERNEVRSFLLSSATFWLDRFHADGLRVDAVASMLYRDYSREEGAWVPNEHGGRENEAAVALLKQINETAYRDFPGIAMIAEESTAWPGVSHPTSAGGLGFGMKWDMGWMHDTLEYLKREPVHRTFHHDEITFRGVYAFSENYVLALSHDEVVHGKGSLFDKMPGDDWQRAANLRLLFGYQAAQPGKSLLFMGMEFGQRREWSHERTLDWDLLQDPVHEGLLNWVRDLNHAVCETPALYERDGDPAGTRWLELGDRANSVLVWARVADASDAVVAVCNFTPVAREAYRIGVPSAGTWVERLNSDNLRYGGSGLTFDAPRPSVEVASMGCSDSVEILVPPLGFVLLQRVTP